MILLYSPISHKWDVPIVSIDDIQIRNKKTKNECYGNKLASFLQNCDGSYFEDEDEKRINGNKVTITAYDTRYHDKYKKIYENYNSEKPYSSPNNFKQNFMKIPCSFFWK